MQVNSTTAKESFGHQCSLVCRLYAFIGVQQIVKLKNLQFGSVLWVNMFCSVPRLHLNGLVHKLLPWNVTVKACILGLFSASVLCFEASINMAFSRLGNGHSVQLLESLWCGNCANLLAVSVNWSGSISRPAETAFKGPRSPHWHT